MTPEEIRMECLKLAADVTMSEDPHVICSYADVLYHYVRFSTFPPSKADDEKEDFDDEDDDDDDRDFDFEVVQS
jgi:hypothetical protein